MFCLIIMITVHDTLTLGHVHHDILAPPILHPNFLFVQWHCQADSDLRPEKFPKLNLCNCDSPACVMMVFSLKSVVWKTQRFK